jgi:threonyl-tRNA synthetase
MATLGRDPIDGDLFEYDLEIGRALTEDDLERIQAEVDRIIAEDLPIERNSLSKGEARAWLIRRGEVLKLEILERISAPTVTIYSHGEFSDLCSGPHLESTGQLPGIRLTSVEEATWQDDPAGERLLRVCGTFA